MKAIDSYGVYSTKNPSVRYKYLAAHQKGRPPSIGDVDAERLPYLSMEYLRRGDGKELVSTDSAVLAENGDTLLLWDGSNAGEFLTARQGVVSSTIARILPLGVEKRFLFWASKAIEPVLKVETIGMGIPHVDGEFLSNIRVPIPCRSEQIKTALFLDAETARIDELVEAKESMLRLLEQKRAALISRAVTCGLDPHAPTKPSDLDWLGDTPKHWTLPRIKHLARIGNGSTPRVDNADYWASENKGYPWLNSSVVNNQEVGNASRYVTTLALNECHLPIVTPPAILVGITGQGKTRGMASLLRYEATINQHVAFIKPTDENIVPEFLRLVIEVAYMFLRTASDGAGSTKGAITCEQLGNLAVPVPPLEEQKSIVAEIETYRKKTRNLSNALADSIKLLKERRSALITAAVTGQIPLEEMAV